MKAHVSEFPVVRLVDNLLDLAIGRSASDIHFEPTTSQLRVRLRIDGILYDHEPVDMAITQQLIARLKVLANINIAEKRIPQDGKFRVIAQGTEIDLRVSTFPALYGEKIVVRILDRADYTMSLDTLGLSSIMADAIKKLISKTSGFFLVCGPTGSGKTTTLYAALSALNSPDKHIITLEDPIEYCVSGVTQAQIHPDAGFTFEKGIRALLRQDPDVVMIGEIRDKQTARIAIEAALTGHQVFSTLHTNDAPSVVMRLMDMGIEPFLINASLSGVLAQRLVRKLCVSCKFLSVPDAQEQVVLSRLGITLENTYKARGCSSCMDLGYKGRTGLFELLLMNNDLRSLIVQYPSFERIYESACVSGMITLMQDGIEKVKEGTISLAELTRVIL